MLLPPKVLGPLNTLSTSITVVGVASDATVQLLVNGSPRGSPVAVSGLSATIPVSPALAAGAQVTATQSRGGQTSAPTPVPEIVAGVPASLPPVVILSGLHPCIDWVLVGGCVAGATVTIEHKGHRIGTAVAAGPQVSVPVSFAQLPGAGDILLAFQSVGSHQGPTSASLPFETRESRQMAAPSVAPPYECDMAVLVSGLQEGASLVVTHDGDELAGYPFVGATVWANLLKPARENQSISVRQESRRCGLASGPSAAVGVNTAPKLPTPVIVGPICPNATILSVRNLRPGATVTVFANRKQPTGGTSILLGEAVAWATDCDLFLPPDWAAHPQIAPPGVLEIAVNQSNCGKGSEQAIHKVEPLPGSVGQPLIQSPVECARLIAVQNLTPGAFVVTTSDQPDGNPLSAPRFVASSVAAIPLYRPLRAGEKIKVMQAGCGVDAASPDTPVASLPGLPAPLIVEPLRIPHGGLRAKGLLVGARVHVFVDETWRASLDATATEMFIPVAGLQRETGVQLRQAMCTRISDASNRAHATLGEMELAIAPEGAIQKGAATSITVTAIDRELRTPVAGKVSIGNSVVGSTGVAFSHLFAAGQPAPASGVNAPDYFFAPIQWNLKEPLPQPPKKLSLDIVNQAPGYFSIAGVQWSIERQELNGTFTLVAAPTGASVSLTPPGNGQYHAYAEVTVDDLINGGTQVAEFRGNVVVHGLSTLLVVWSGADYSHTFRLTAEPVTIFAGGTAYTLYKPVVVT